MPGAITEHHLNPPAYVEQVDESWEEIVTFFMQNREDDDNNKYARGEKAVYTERKHGKGTILKLAVEVGIPKKKIQEAMKVVKAFDRSVREEFKRLSYTHLRIIQQRFEDEKTRLTWLESAHDNNWSTENLIMEIKKGDPEKTFNIEKSKEKILREISKVEGSVEEGEFKEFMAWLFELAVEHKQAPIIQPVKEPAGPSEESKKWFRKRGFNKINGGKQSMGEDS